MIFAGFAQFRLGSATPRQILVCLSSFSWYRSSIQRVFSNYFVTYVLMFHCFRVSLDISVSLLLLARPLNLVR